MSVKAKNIQATIKIPNADEYTSDELAAIGQDIVNFIRKRTEQGLDVNGDEFKPYTIPKGKKESPYENSLAFKIAGKTKGKVDLKLSGDMLAMLRVLETKKNAVKIGYDTSDAEAGRAEGNQIGSYGQPRANSKKARPFIGIDSEQLKAILAKYPLDNDAKREKRAEKVNAGRDLSGAIVDELFGEDDG